MIEWEASSISLLENLENSGSLCASVVNPGINDTQQSVQIQVKSENFTAQGSASILLLNMHYHICFLLQQMRTISLSQKS